MASEPELPIAISAVGGKYLLFDIEAVSWLRRKHQLCGAFIGTLPQNPAQNVFLGLPVQIMPEEAQLLVDKGLGYVVDDAQVHESAMQIADMARRSDYLANIRYSAGQISTAKAKEKEQERQKKMKQQKSRRKSKDGGLQTGSTDEIGNNDLQDLADEDTTLFDSTSTIRQSSSTTKTAEIGIKEINDLYVDHSITPTTSAMLLPTPPKTPSNQPDAPSKSIPDLPASYPLYRHLNSRGFFMTPGLRFGCQYCVYPGDPLRFHSHFLATGVSWDEEIDLMDIVAGGRLGTGVKKGYLIGGEEPNGLESGNGQMRTYSIEWAAM